MCCFIVILFWPLYKGLFHFGYILSFLHNVLLHFGSILSFLLIIHLGFILALLLQIALLVHCGSSIVVCGLFRRKKQGHVTSRRTLSKQTVVHRTDKPNQFKVVAR